MRIVLTVLVTAAATLVTAIPLGDSSSDWHKSPPTVHLSTGAVSGIVNGDLIEFRGVPFATPPVGDLRFKAPLPPQRHSGTLNASAYQNACMQNPNLALEVYANPGYSEDCLYANVYKSKAAWQSHKPVPVMIWIYGGGFTTGAGSVTQYYPNSLLADADSLGTPFIVVTFNYRMGAFGFLGSTEIPPEDINAGLLDQRQLMRWVHKEIHAFGGDASQVTLWGESAGAISISWHALFSDPAEKLFRAIIMDSGNALTGPVRTQEQWSGPGGYLPGILAATGCDGVGSSVACLRRLSAADLLAKTTAYTSMLFAAFPWIPLIGPKGAYLTGRATDLFPTAASRYPSIAGFNNDEGTIFAPLNASSLADGDYITFCNVLSHPNPGPDFVPEMDKVYPLTPALESPFDRPELRTESPYYHRAAALFGDSYFIGATKSYLDLTKGRGYGYHFNTIMPTKFPAFFGVYHSSELAAVWGHIPPSGTATQDALLAKMAREWRHNIVNFIITTNPNGGGAPSWPAYSRAGNLRYITIGQPKLSNFDIRAPQLAYLATLDKSLQE